LSVWLFFCVFLKSSLDLQILTPNGENIWKWGEYLEIWKGERIGSGSDQTTWIVTKDVEYVRYSATTIEE